jgi:hypothetical protein
MVNKYFDDYRFKAAPLATGTHKIFMAAIFAFHTGKALAQIVAIEITVDHLFNVRPPESVLSCEMFIIRLDKNFKIVLHAVVIIRILRSAGLVYGCRQYHVFLT